MSLDARLNKVAPMLTSQERAILVLESWKEGKQEDPAWRHAMPGSQAPEFNRLIDLMNGANLGLAHYIALLAEQADKVELRQAWLVTIVLWDEQVDMITRAVRLGLKEPITRGEHAALLQAQAQEWVPVDELADVLAGDYSDWSEEDFEEEDGERDITDAAWDRVCAEKERELRRLVAAGELNARGRGANLRIQAGSFDAHFGQTTAAMPEDLLDYRVFADDQADDAATEKARQQRIFDALEWRRLSIKGEPDEPRVLDKIAGALRTGIAGCFAECWQQFRACEIAIEETAAAFNGIDPLRPHNREVLDGAKEKLVYLQRELEFLDVKIETPEPDEELMTLVLRIARRG